MSFSPVPKRRKVSSSAYQRWLKQTIGKCEVCWHLGRRQCSRRLEAHHVLARGKGGDDRVDNLIVLGKNGIDGCHELVGNEGLSTELIVEALQERLTQWRQYGMFTTIKTRWPEVLDGYNED